MATLDTSGIDDLQDQLKRIEAGLRGECIKAMLQAGGDAMAKQWQQTLSVGAHAHISNGKNSTHMADSVKVTNIQLDLDGGTATVMPDGYDDKGVAQALKAWAINTGAGYIKKKDPFVKAAEKDAQQAVDAAMQAVLDEYLRKEG